MPNHRYSVVRYKVHVKRSLDYNDNLECQIGKGQFDLEGTEFCRALKFSKPHRISLVYPLANNLKTKFPSASYLFLPSMLRNVTTFG